MQIKGLHLLLTYQCTFECDHCFAWGSPWQSGTMDINQVRKILAQARELDGLRSIYFEGGEPFLYYATLVTAVEESASAGYEVGIVSNAFWATSLEDAMLNLEPFTRSLQDLTVSSDLFHYSQKLSRQAENARLAAERLGIPIGTIMIARPDEAPGKSNIGQIEAGDGAVMYRGRAVEKLVSYATKKPWDTFTTCPHEDLRDPGRVHIDPLGYIHICQGLTLGNLNDRPMSEIFGQFNPEDHPIVGPLLSNGPKGLVETYNLPHETHYADACHLCYQARLALRQDSAEYLAPDQMYGMVS